MEARHYSQLYRHIRDLDPTEYQRIIRRYEEKEDEIGRLDVLEYFELTVYYVNALFHSGAYRQHLLMADLVIEGSIRYSIRRVEGVEGDIFQHLLFQKAASAFRLREFDLADHIVRELIRMAPANDHYFRFLRIILFQRNTNILQVGRALFISCLLTAALLITIDLLFIASFYPDFTDTMHAAILIVFSLALLFLLVTYGYNALRAHHKVTRFRRGQTNN